MKATLTPFRELLEALCRTETQREWDAALDDLRNFMADDPDTLLALIKEAGK